MDARRGIILTKIRIYMKYKKTPITYERTPLPGIRSEYLQPADFILYMIQ